MPTPRRVKSPSRWDSFLTTTPSPKVNVPRTPQDLLARHARARGLDAGLARRASRRRVLQAARELPVRQLMGGDVISDQYLEGCYRLGMHYPGPVRQHLSRLRASDRRLTLGDHAACTCFRTWATSSSCMPPTDSSPTTMSIHQAGMDQPEPDSDQRAAALITVPVHDRELVRADCRYRDRRWPQHAALARRSSLKTIDNAYRRAPILRGLPDRAGRAQTLPGDANGGPRGWRASRRCCRLSRPRGRGSSVGADAYTPGAERPGSSDGDLPPGRRDRIRQLRRRRPRAVLRGRLLGGRPPVAVSAAPHLREYRQFGGPSCPGCPSSTC